MTQLQAWHVSTHQGWTMRRDEASTPYERSCSTLYSLSVCNSKFPWTRWLKGTETHSFTALEIGSPNLRCWQGHTSSKRSRGESFLASSSFWRFLAVLDLWQHLSNPSLIVSQLSSSLCVSLLFGSSFLMTPVIGFKAKSRSLAKLHLQKSYCQIRLHSAVEGG